MKRENSVNAIAKGLETIAADAEIAARGKMGDAVLFGLVGRGIGLSRTPWMHEAEAAHFGLRGVYRLLDTDAMARDADGNRPGLAEVLRAAELAGFSGINVTYPYKREALDLVDSLSDSARRVGAINTIVFKDGKRSGHNTDCWGFAESFRRGMDGARRDSVLLLGAGGAGGAVANALIDCGVQRLSIFDTDGASAARLAARLSELTSNASGPRSRWGSPSIWRGRPARSTALSMRRPSAWRSCRARRCRWIC
ncbi:ThiF family adenylyltransferase [Breoghania sp. L-A4]|uniref:ThiF family adenylyltransferase n=1 Tax=Breoghania sp. L-A4 TaxID=2304600 RepID=UPI0032046CE5